MIFSLKCLNPQFQTDWSTHCSGCAYPLCSVCILTSQSSSTFLEEHHSELECKILATLNNDIPLEEIKANSTGATKIQLPNFVYEPVLAIRLLLLHQTQPDQYKIAQTFMDHEEERKTISPEYWKHSVSTVINPIVQSFQKNNSSFSIFLISSSVRLS